jgi:hypothetical protein
MTTTHFLLDVRSWVRPRRSGWRTALLCAHPVGPFTVISAARHHTHHAPTGYWKQSFIQTSHHMPRVALSCRACPNARQPSAHPKHPAWHGHGRESIAAAPAETSAPEEPSQTFIDAPDKLPLRVLDWLTHEGIMMAAHASALTMYSSA